MDVLERGIGMGKIGDLKGSDALAGIYQPIVGWYICAFSDGDKRCGVLVQDLGHPLVIGGLASPKDVFCFCFYIEGGKVRHTALGASSLRSHNHLVPVPEQHIPAKVIYCELGISRIIVNICRGTLYDSTGFFTGAGRIDEADSFLLGSQPFLSKQGKM